MLTVEERLPFIIRQRLEAEIKKNPPLFPWETVLEEYEATEPESGHPKPIDKSSSPKSSSTDD